MTPLWQSCRRAAVRIVSAALEAPATRARFMRRCEIWQLDAETTAEDVRLIICMGAVRLALDASPPADAENAARIPASDIARSVSNRPAYELLTALPDHIAPHDRPPAARLISVIGSTSDRAAIHWERLALLVRDIAR
ncbi:hypothetical protein [Kitasatospora sp. NPDC004531]